MNVSRKKGLTLITLTVVGSIALGQAAMSGKLGSGLASAIADWTEDPSVRAWNPYPPIVSISIAELPLGQTVQLGQLKVRFTTDPGQVTAGQDTKFFWTVTDRDGRHIDLHRVMHGIPMHVYAVRDDLAGDVIHMHPTEQPDGITWKDRSTFASAGKWRVQMQGTHGGVLYEFSTPIDVVGPEAAVVQPDDARVRTMFEYEVRLETDPAEPVAGEPTRVHYIVKQTPELPIAQVVKAARVQHNLIIAQEGSSLLWNNHGDGSVDAVAAKAPIVVKRRFSPEDPFDYTMTFPTPGLWLVHFEYMAEGAQFWVRVKGK